MTSTSIEERPVFFPSGSSTLAGILAIPVQPNGRAVLLAWGGSPLPSSGRNRERVRLGRELAEEGFHTFRFDYQGVGESEGELRRADMSAPHTEDIVAASTWLRSQGHPRVIIVANCFGSWSSLMSAPMIRQLEAVALVNGPVWRSHGGVGATRSLRWWSKKVKRFRLGKLRSAERRALYLRLLRETVGSTMRARSASGSGSRSRDSRYSQAVGHLLDRGIPTFLIYGNDDFRADFDSELANGLRARMEESDTPTRLVTVPDKLAVWSRDAQDLLMRELLPWLRELVADSESLAEPLPQTMEL